MVLTKRMLPVVAITLVVGALIGWLMSNGHKPVPDEEVKTRSTPSAPASAKPRPPMPPKVTGAPVVVDAIVQSDIDSAVVLYSPEALPTFERFLASNEPDVREAARDGLVRLGETGGAALLRHATARMTDPEEIKRMLETADYLELPSALDGPLKK